MQKTHPNCRTVATTEGGAEQRIPAILRKVALNMKVIFLDIDGVMNHTGHFKRSDKHILQEFCPRSVENLREIVEVCNAKIVVSSAWRKIFRTTKRLRKELFCHYSLERRVIGLTPVIRDAERGMEIRWYIDHHKISEKNIVILDDDADMGDLLPRLVRTSFFNGGLTVEKKDEAIRMLGC